MNRLEYIPNNSNHDKPIIGKLAESKHILNCVAKTPDRISLASYKLTPLSFAVHLVNPFEITHHKHLVDTYYLLHWQQKYFISKLQIADIRKITDLYTTEYLVINRGGIYYKILFQNDFTKELLIGKNKKQLQKVFTGQLMLSFRVFKKELNYDNIVKVKYKN